MQSYHRIGGSYGCAVLAIFRVRSYQPILCGLRSTGNHMETENIKINRPDSVVLWFHFVHFVLDNSDDSSELSKNEVELT